MSTAQPEARNNDAQVLPISQNGSGTGDAKWYSLNTTDYYRVNFKTSNVFSVCVLILAVLVFPVKHFIIEERYGPAVGQVCQVFLIMIVLTMSFVIFQHVFLPWYFTDSVQDKVKIATDPLYSIAEGLMDVFREAEARPLRTIMLLTENKQSKWSSQASPIKDQLEAIQQLSYTTSRRLVEKEEQSCSRNQEKDLLILQLEIHNKTITILKKRIDILNMGEKLVHRRLEATNKRLNSLFPGNNMTVEQRMTILKNQSL